MLFKKVIFFITFFSIMNVNAVYAKDVKYPVDTAALQAALAQIKVIGYAERDEDKVAAAKAEFGLYFMQNKGKKLSVKDITKKCKSIINNSVSCMDFIETYDSYMDHANACLTANNFEKVRYEGKNYSFKECYNNSDFKRYYMSTDKVYDDDLTYASSSLYGQCKRWIEAANICQKYLIVLYSQKLDVTKDKNAKNTYKCVVEKIQSGDISFPLDREKLEQSCDAEFQRIHWEGEAAMYEAMLGVH